MKRYRIIALISALLLCALVFSGCGNSAAEGLDSVMYAEIDMANGDYIKLELYTNVAPITVANFVSLVNDHFYDGLIFHRVISDFMIQAGDPTGTGSGGSDKTIKGEFQQNGVQNGLSHTRGVISMARRRKDMNSASSQFFIVQKDSPHLDGQYAAFGKVIEGIEAVDKIASVATDAYDKPLSDQVIRSIRIITKEQAKAAGPAPESTDTSETK